MSVFQLVTFAMNFINKMVVVSRALTILSLLMANVFMMMFVLGQPDNTRKLMDLVVLYMNYVMITTWKVVCANHVLLDMRSISVVFVVKRITIILNSNVEHSI